MSKTRKILLAVVFAFVAAFYSAVVDPSAAIASAPSGEGTANDPWQIRTVADLEWINTIHIGAGRENQHFLLMNNITTPNDFMIGGVGVVSNYNFTGTFDGGDNTITVNIYQPGTNRVGLFRQILGTGVVRNITVVGTVTGYILIGGLAGENAGGTVEYVTANVNVTGYSEVGVFLSTRKCSEY